MTKYHGESRSRRELTMVLGKKRLTGMARAAG
jgi:hypothetical protein